MICEDCNEFICSQCAKNRPQDHDWKTIPSEGSLRRRELKKALCKAKKKDATEITEKGKEGFQTTLLNSKSSAIPEK